MAEKKINGKTAASAVVAVTAAGMLVGGSFASPDEILDEGPGPVVQSLNTDAQPADDVQAQKDAARGFTRVEGEEAEF